MKRAETMRAALGGRTTREVAIWELEFHGWDWASGKHAVLGREFEKLGDAEKARAVEENAEIICAVAERYGFGGVTTPGSYWEVSPGEPAYWWLPEGWREKQAAAIRKRGGDFVLVAGTGGVMCMPGALEYEDFAIKLFENPDEIEERAKRSLAGGIERAKRMRDAGAEAVFSASDIADNHGPFFNPAQMERFILPYLRAWAAAVREMGVYSILHTDGNITSILEGIAASGVQALQAIDPVAGMDIRETRRIVDQRLCLCGNLDCGLLLTGMPEKIAGATRELVEVCRGKGPWVLGASNAVEGKVPRENYEAMIGAVREMNAATCGSKTCP